MGMTTVQFSASPDCSHNYGIVLPSYMQSFFPPRLEGLSGQGSPVCLAGCCVLSTQGPACICGLDAGMNRYYYEQIMGQGLAEHLWLYQGGAPTHLGKGGAVPGKDSHGTSPEEPSPGPGLAACLDSHLANDGTTWDMGRWWLPLPQEAGWPAAALLYFSFCLSLCPWS